MQISLIALALLCLLSTVAASVDFDFLQSSYDEGTDRTRFDYRITSSDTSISNFNIEDYSLTCGTIELCYVATMECFDMDYAGTFGGTIHDPSVDGYTDFCLFVNGRRMESKGFARWSTDRNGKSGDSSKNKISLPICDESFTPDNPSYINKLLGATNNQGVYKVNICHRTNAATNPYVSISVDINALKEGHSTHTGHVFDGVKDGNNHWGDIIPPVVYNNQVLIPSLNWDEAGRAIWYNDCEEVDDIVTPEDIDPLECSLTASFQCAHNKLLFEVTATTPSDDVTLDWSTSSADASIINGETHHPVVSVPVAAMAGACSMNLDVTLSISKDGESASCSLQLTGDYGSDLYWLDADLPSQNIDTLCGDVPSFPFLRAAQECIGSVEVNFDETDDRVGNAYPYTLTRTWSTNEACFNDLSWTQSVVVSDSGAPDLELEEGIVHAECGAIPARCDPTAQDPCGGDVTLDYSETKDTESYHCSANFDIIRSWTATGSGGSKSIAQRVVVRDTQEPSLVGLPADGEHQCHLIPGMANVHAEDACEGTLGVTALEQPYDASQCSFEIQRSWAAVDECSNSADHTQTLSIIDTEAPVFDRVLSDTSYECNTRHYEPCEFQAVDNCHAVSISNASVDTLVGLDGCLHDIDRLVTYTASDGCGNEASTSRTEHWRDTQGPTFSTELTNTHVEALCDAVPHIHQTYHDACSSVESSEAISILSSTSDDQYTKRWDWTAVDACGNSASSFMELTVSDNVKPVLSGLSADQTLSCDASYSPPTVTATDNCNCGNSNPEVTENIITVSETSCRAEYKYEYSALDCTGNFAGASHTVVVEDVDAPILSLDGGASAATISIEDFADYEAPTASASDNCQEVDVVTSDEVNPGSCPHSFQKEWTFSANDGCNTPVTKSFTLTVIDEEAPVITGVADNSGPFCPNDSFIADWNSADDLNGLSFSDNSGGEISTSATQVNPADMCDGIVKRTYTAVDQCGNTASESTQITVGDFAYPTWDSYNHQTSITYEFSQDLALVSPPAPTASDDCHVDVSGPTVSVTPTSCDAVFTKEYKFFAVDECQHKIDFTVTYNVQDTTSPVISRVGSAPADFTLGCGGSIPLSSFSASDASWEAPQTVVEYTDTVLSSTDCQTVTKRVFKICDCSNNCATTEETWTSNDTDKPTFVNPPANTDFECVEDLPACADLTFNDECAGYTDSVSCSEESVGGDIVRKWSGSDLCGNTVEHTQLIKITDSQDPSLSADDVNVECPQLPPIQQPTYDDNCEGFTLTSDVSSTTSGCGLETSFHVEWTVTDASGQTSSTTQHYASTDNTAPQWTSSISADSLHEQCASPEPESPVAVDTCVGNDHDMSVKVTDINHANDGVKVTFDRVYSVADACGNDLSVTQAIKVHDTEKPVLLVNLPENKNFQCGGFIMPSSSASDNCDAIDVDVTTSTSGNSCSSQIATVWTACDDSNNCAASVSATFNEVDSAGPHWNSETYIQTFSAEYTGNEATTFAEPLGDGDNWNEYSDDCQIPTMECTRVVISGDCDHKFDIVFTCTLDDGCHTPKTRVQTISISDTTDPSVCLSSDANACVEPPLTKNLDVCYTAGMDLSTHFDAIDMREFGVSVGALTAQVVSQSGSDGCGQAKILYTGADVCGNDISIEQTLHFTDSVDPELTIDYEHTRSCEELPGSSADWIATSATDNCDADVTVALTSSDYTGCVKGETAFPCTASFEYTASDGCGNQVSEQVSFDFEDTTAPVFGSLPADAVLEYPSSASPSTPDATDSCDTDPEVSVTSTTVTVGCPYNMTTTYSFTATDNSGNSVTSTEVTYETRDTIPPTLSLTPGPITVFESVVPDVPVVTGTDPSDGSTLNVIFTQTPVALDSPLTEETVITRTWLVEDACGHQTVHIQLITVIPEPTPEIFGVPTDETITCGSPASYTEDEILAQVVASLTDPDTEVASSDGCTVVNHEADANWDLACSLGLRITTCTFKVTKTYADASTVFVTDDWVLTVVDDGNPVWVPESTNGLSGMDYECELGNETPLATDCLAVTVTGPVDEAGQLARTWTATDTCANAITFTQAYTISDYHDPTFTEAAPADLSLACDEAVPAQVELGSEDNCGDVTQTMSEIKSSGECDETSTITRKWKLTDGYQRTAITSQTIEIVDDSPPAWIGDTPAPTLTVGCFEAVADHELEGTDDCGEATVTSTDDYNKEELYYSRPHQAKRTYTVTDSCGNKDTLTQIITVVDTTPPAYNSNNPTLECSTADIASVLGSNAVETLSASDECDANPADTAGEWTIDDSDKCIITASRGYDASDYHNNTATATQTVTIQDTTAPSWDSDALVGEAVGECGVNAVTPERKEDGTDSCQLSDLEYFVVSSESPALTGLETSKTVVTWGLRDSCGNTNTESYVFTATNLDTIAPQLSLIDGVEETHQCVTPQPPVATATDECDSDVDVTRTASISAQTCTNSYTETHTWIATDNVGHEHSVSHIYHAVDTQAPQLSCTMAGESVSCVDQVITSECGQSLVVPVVKSSDNCRDEEQEISPVITGNATHKVYTWTDTDACLNKASFSYTYAIVDTSPPYVLVSPDDVSFFCDEEPSIPFPTWKDDCSAISATTKKINTAAGTCSESYTEVWQITATDESGLSASTTVSVNIMFRSDVSISGFQASDSMTCSDIYDETPTVTDLCVPWIVQNTSHVGDCPEGNGQCQFFDFSATTSSGCAAPLELGTTVVELIDTVDPTFDAEPQDQLIGCSDSFSPFTVEASDNCDQEVVVSHTCADINTCIAGSQTCTYTATDHAGNSASTEVTLAYEDTEAPALEFINGTAIVDGAELAVFVECGEIEPEFHVLYSDNCVDGKHAASSSTQAVDVSEAQTAAGITKIEKHTFSATDGCGLQTSASIIVTFGDTIAPSLTNANELNGEHLTVECDQALPECDFINGGDCSGSDICDSSIVPVFTDTTTSSDDCATILQRTITVTDGVGHTESAAYTIEIVDTTDPTISFSANNSPYDTYNLQCKESFPTFVEIVEDNCSEDLAAELIVTDAATGAIVDIDASLSYVGSFEYTWSAHDDCGHEAQTSATFDVTDTSPPVFAPTPATHTYECGALIEYPEPTATDNCDEITPSLIDETKTETGCPCEHSTSLTYEAQDASGNTDSITVTIIVEDTTPPELLNIPESVTVEHNFDDIQSALDHDAVAIDNGRAIEFDVTLTYMVDDVEVSAAAIYQENIRNFQIIQTFTTVDCSGNKDEKFRIITVLDTTPPVFENHPEDVQVQCGSQLLEYTDTENICDVDADKFEIAHYFSSVFGAKYDIISMTIDVEQVGNVVTRTWTATDSSGNSHSITQTITQDDNSPPRLSHYPQDQDDVECACDVLDTPDIGLIDNCEDLSHESPVFTQVQNSIPDGFEYVRTWSYQGLVLHSQSIKVKDTTAPSLLNIPASNPTVECSAIPSVPTVWASDKCDPSLDPPVAINVVETTSSTASPSSCNAYTLTRSWSSTDNFDNAASHSQTITVVDTESPYVSQPGAKCVPASHTLVTVTKSDLLLDLTDNCNDASAITISFTGCNSTLTSDDESGAFIPGSCFVDSTSDAIVLQGQAGEAFDITFTVTDQCDNSASIVQTYFTPLDSEEYCDQSWMQ